MHPLARRGFVLVLLLVGLAATVAAARAVTTNVNAVGPFTRI